jgi:Flp pilus assembly pilin Flp
MTIWRERGNGGSKKTQRGASAVEFGLVAVVFFVLLLGIIEFGRIFYLWNTVQEVTRRAAREAVVRGFAAADQNAVKGASVFHCQLAAPGQAYPSSCTGGTFSLPGGAEVTNLRVDLRYLNASMDDVSPMPSDVGENFTNCEADRNGNDCIRFVEARICQPQGNNCNPVQYAGPLLGFFPFLAVDIPASTVVMPAESLGFRPVSP